MDGWETRRKRIQGHDFCIIKLGLPGSIRAFEVDTAHFTGNHVPFISIQGVNMSTEIAFNRKSVIGTSASTEEVSKVQSLTETWPTMLPITKLEPGYPETRFNCFNSVCADRVTHIRVNMHPDGGIAR